MTQHDTPAPMRCGRLMPRWTVSRNMHVILQNAASSNSSSRNPAMTDILYDDEEHLDPVWVCIVCGWEGDPDKVGRFCPCGDRDLDKEEADAE